MQRIGDFNCYVIGPQDAKRVILGVYDVFGLWPSTQQGADLLSSMTGARVVMPDLFQGCLLYTSPSPRDGLGDVYKRQVPGQAAADRHHPGRYSGEAGLAAAVCVGMHGYMC